VTPPQWRADRLLDAPGGSLSRVLSFTIARGKIVEVAIIVALAQLRGLDLAVVKESGHKTVFLRRHGQETGRLRE
jgi:hypothetical protein